MLDTSINIEALPAHVLLSDTQIGEVLGVHPRTVKRWHVRDQDPLPCLRVNGRPRTKAGELRLWLKKTEGCGRADA